MRARTCVFILICFLVIQSHGFAQHHSSHESDHMDSANSSTHHHSLRPDEYPPVGVMGGHTHHKGGCDVIQDDVYEYGREQKRYK